MHRYRKINELFEGGSVQLTSLKRRCRERSKVLQHVRGALPEEFSGWVTNAGVQGNELTVGARNAAWAARLRYAVDALRERVGLALGVEIDRVRIRVQPMPKT